MENLPLIHLALLKLHKNVQLTAEQQRFIGAILNGRPGASGWRNFKSIVKTPPPLHTFEKISVLIFQEIKRTSYWDFKKRKVLENASAILLGSESDEKKIAKIKDLLETDPVISNLESRSKINRLLDEEITPCKEIDNLIAAISQEIQHCSSEGEDYQDTLSQVQIGLVSTRRKRIERQAIYRNATKKIDKLYETIAKYGTLMLPVQQGLDPNLGTSQGECHGYALLWSKNILLKKRFFGVSQDIESTFHYIPSLSDGMENYLGLNHLAPLNIDVARYQRCTRKKVSKLLSEEGTSNITEEIVEPFVLYTSDSALANRMISATNRNPDNVSLWHLRGFSGGGHAIALYKTDDHYHFFDSNIGWVRFSSADAFVSWLPLYFKSTGYSKRYFEAALYSVGFQENQKPNHEIYNPFCKAFSLEAICNLFVEKENPSVLDKLLFLISIPLITLTLCVIALDLIFIHPIRYLIHQFNNSFSGVDPVPGDGSRSVEAIDSDTERDGTSKEDNHTMHLANVGMLFSSTNVVVPKSSFIDDDSVQQQVCQ